MAQEDEFVPAPGRLFGSPEVDVGPLYVPTADYQVLGLAQEQRLPPDGRVIPDITVSFLVPGLPGVFTRRIDNYAFTHADVLAYMQERSALIRALYALPGDVPPEPVTPLTVTV